MVVEQMKVPETMAEGLQARRGFSLILIFVILRRS